MDLYNELLQQYPDTEKLLIEQTEAVCYRILREIQAIISNPELTDENCFYRIEALVCLFEKYHLHCGGRHDF